MDRSIEKIRTYYFDKPNVMDIKLDQLKLSREQGICIFCKGSIEVEFSYDFIPPDLVWRCKKEDCSGHTWNKSIPQLKTPRAEED
jgi:hypothetical protein